MSVEDAEPLNRSFLDSLITAQPESSMAEQPEDGEYIRPYFLTGGRVHEGGGAIETVYSITEYGRNPGLGLNFERQAIARLCHDPQSVAEISAHLQIPLGVAAVLARDLAGDSVLVASVATVNPGGDPSLIMRIIHAVHAL